MGWSKLWEEHCGQYILVYLNARDVGRLIQVEKTCKRSIAKEILHFRQQSARLGLSLWCQQKLKLTFESYYQEQVTQTISRSSLHDPRVPPRVVHIWEERGLVPEGVVTLRPQWLTKVDTFGALVRFTVTDKQPILTNVIQNTRRIYTIVTVEIETESAERVVLRKLAYLKEYGEWRTFVPAQEKRMYDKYGAQCRFDLVSIDGSIALELDLPSGTDAMQLDYYFIKCATVVLPMDELLQRHRLFHTITPTLDLPLASRAHPGGTRGAECMAELRFTSLNGSLLKTVYRLMGRIIREQQMTEGNDSLQLTARTALEHFDVVTFHASPNYPVHIELPQKPGYIWIMLIHPNTRQRYFVTTMLHRGTQRHPTRTATISLNAQWVPGVLEYDPTPQSRHRRCLKGRFHISSHVETHSLIDVTMIAQHIESQRLERYAARFESYTRPPHT